MGYFRIELVAETILVWLKCRANSQGLFYLINKIVDMKRVFRMSCIGNFSVSRQRAHH